MPVLPALVVRRGALLAAAACGAGCAPIPSLGRACDEAADCASGYVCDVGGAGVCVPAFADVDGGAGLVDGGAGREDGGPPPACERPAEGCAAIDAPVVVIEPGDAVCVDLRTYCEGACDPAFAADGGVVACPTPTGEVLVTTTGAAPSDEPVHLDVGGAIGRLSVFVVGDAQWDARWTGAVDGDFLRAENWQGGVVPGEASRVLVPRGVARTPSLPPLDGGVATPTSIGGLLVATGARGQGSDSALKLLSGLVVACDVVSGDLLVSEGPLAPIGLTGCGLVGSRLAGSLSQIEIGRGGVVRVVAAVTTRGDLRAGNAARLLDADTGSAVLEVGAERLWTRAAPRSGQDQEGNLQSRAAEIVLQGGTIRVDDDLELGGTVASSLRAGEVLVSDELGCTPSGVVFGDEVQVQIGPKIDSVASVECASPIPRLAIHGDAVVDDEDARAQHVVVQRELDLRGALSVRAGDTLETVAGSSLRIRAGAALVVESGGVAVVGGALVVEDGGVCAVRDGGQLQRPDGGAGCVP